MLMDQFYMHMREQGKSELTIRQYRSSWSRFVAFMDQQDPHQRGTGAVFSRRLTDEKYILSATILDVADFKRLMEKGGGKKPFHKPYSPRTVQQTLIHLNVIFRYFFKKGVIPSNPVKATDRKVVVQQEAPKWLTRAQQNTLIREVNFHSQKLKKNGFRERAIIPFLLHTGLRVQELCDLRLSDILHLGERSGQIIVRGKGNKTRKVRLNSTACRILREYFAVHTPKGEYVFDSQRSDKMTPRAVQHMVEKYAKITGIPDLTPHVLRHTFCHNLVKAGVPLDQIALLAGHMKEDGSPNLAMTVRYTQPDDNDLAEAVEKIAW
jgi:site-specific recombinase XerD